MTRPLTDTRSIIKSFYKIIIFFSLAISAVVFIGMSGYRYVDYKKSLENEKAAVNSVIESNLRLLLTEIYLSQNEAINLRLESIAKSSANLLNATTACAEVSSKVSSFNGGKYCTNQSVNTSGLSWHERHLTIGSIDFGTLRVGVLERPFLSGIITQRLLVMFLLVLIVGILTTIVLARAMKVEVLDKFVARLRQESQNAAIAKTAQQLAHDVRSPFSLIKNILQSIANLDDPHSIKALAKNAIPDIERRLTYVNDMMRDVMEVGKSTIRETANVNTEEFIQSALKDSFIRRPHPNISVSYSLNHSRKLKVDSAKVNRLFANLVSNAADAMQHLDAGEIWFETIDALINGQNFIQITIGNHGSLTKDDISNLFEPFFTKGKHDGTGLGLAVAKNVVESHGSKINCRFLPPNRIEFIFGLPASNELADYRGPFYRNSIDVGEISSKKFTVQTTLKPAIPTIYLIEDEVWFREPWKLVVNGKYNLLMFDSAEAFLRQINDVEPENTIIVTDYYLGNGLNGADLALKIKQKLPTIPIMLFSDYPDGDFPKTLFTIKIPKCTETAMAIVDIFFKRKSALADIPTIAIEKSMSR